MTVLQEHDRSDPALAAEELEMLRRDLEGVDRELESLEGRRTRAQRELETWTGMEIGGITRTAAIARYELELEHLDRQIGGRRARRDDIIRRMQAIEPIWLHAPVHAHGAIVPER